MPGGYSSRRFRFFRAGETLKCPNGHRYKDPLVWQSGGLRCNHEGANGRHDCGATVLLIGGGFADSSGHPITMLIEVTPQELHAMSLGRMDVDAMLHYLGVADLPAIADPLLRHP